LLGVCVIQTVLLDTGKAALATSVAEGLPVQVVAYSVGQAANYVPDTSSLEVLPNAVFTGDASTISSSVINTDEIRYTITLLEPVGPFNVGNIMLFIQLGSDPTLIPYLYGVLPVAVPKYANNPPATIGNRLVFNLTAEYTNVSEAFNLEVVTPNYSSLPNYRDENDLPTPETAVYQQSVLQNCTITGAPALTVRRSIDDSWFINPFFSRIDDPEFGSLNGGIVGDNYVPYVGAFNSGGFYITPLAGYNQNMDGGDGWGVPGAADNPVDGGSF
jgi:hypothetical protein